MEQPLNIESELKRYRLHQLKSLDSAYWFEHRLPAVTHTHAIGALQNGLYVGTMAGDSFDLGLASAVIQFVSERQAEMNWSIPGQILTGFQCHGFGFDCVLLFSPKVHKLYLADSRILHSRTVQAVPIYRCEFSGDESADILLLIRQKYVPTTDWRREPAPRVLMYAYDANLEARSRGHKPGITTKSQAFYQIHETTRSDKSWIEICNYRGECVRISCPGGHYVVESVKSKLRQEVALGSIDRWTDRFLIIGLEEITEPHAPRMPLPPAPSEPKLVIFLSDQETGVHINMAEQDIVDLTEALNQFDRLSEQEGSSIGFKRNDGQLLKFTWNEGSILQVDIPLGEGSSLRGRGTWDGLRPLIPQFAAGVPVRELPGLQLQSGSLRRNLDESL